VISPVPESLLVRSISRVDASRQSEFGAVLRYRETVMSAVFHIQLPQLLNLNTTVRYPMSVRLQAALPSKAATAEELCLARLNVRSEWVCTLYGRQLQLDYELGYYLGSFTTSGTYAIVLQPRVHQPTSPPIAAVQPSWWAIYGVTFGVSTSGVFVLTAALVFMGVRLLRYRKKYKEKRRENEELENQIELLKFEANTEEMDLNVNPSYFGDANTDMSLRELKETRKTLKALRSQLDKEKTRTSEMEQQLAELKEYKKRLLAGDGEEE